MFLESRTLTQQKGQATTELLVSLAVIAPLFLLIPVVANYLDIQTATHEASRFVAWERTAYTSIDEGEVASKVKERFVNRESSGFSVASIGDVDVRWKDYGSIGRSSLVDASEDVAVNVDFIPVNISDPVASSNIGAIQAMNPNALGATAVSVPLASEGSLLATFSGGATYLQGERNAISAPYDDIAETNRFHTKATAVLLAANSIVPQNESAYSGTTDAFVTSDGNRLGIWQAPLKLLNVVTLGFFDELDILNDDGGLEAVSDEQSVILPEYN